MGKKGAPKISMPKISAPKISAPKISAPKISAPKISMPKISAPKISMPKIKAPKIKAPKIKVPKIKVPKIKGPKLKLPKLGKSKKSSKKSKKSSSGKGSSGKSQDRRDITRAINPILLKLIKTLLPVIIVFIVLFLPIAHGLQNHKYFDMSIIASILVNPVFILVVLIIIVLSAYFNYSSKMEQWYYYSIGSGSSAPPYMAIFTAIVLFDVFIGIRVSNGTGVIEGIKDAIARAKATFAFYASPVSAIIFFLIYLIFTMMNLRIASAFFIIFLYFHSYLGMAVYADGGVPAGYKEITSSIYNALSEDGKECVANGSVEKIVRRALRFVFENLTLIIFCIILFSSIFNYKNDMKSEAKSTFILMNGIIIVGVFALKIIYSFLDSTEYTTSSDYDMPK